MNRPVIGVMPLWDESKNSFWMVPDYMRGVEQAGGLPVMLPLSAQASVVTQICETFHGFLFTGGQDVCPQLYGEEPISNCGEMCRARDEMERRFFQEGVLEMDKPALGICRGLQLFNVLLGGTLYQDIPTQQDGLACLTHQQQPPYDRPHHEVTILPDTPLHALLETDTLPVNSYHHQAIKKLAKGFVPMAASADGLVEAAYLPSRSFVQAVQWHPEYSLEDPASQLLFTSLIKACQDQMAR